MSAGSRTSRTTVRGTRGRPPLVREFAPLDRGYRTPPLGRYVPCQATTGGVDDEQRRADRHDRDGRRSPSRSPSVVPLALDDRDRVGHRLDARRARGHDGRQRRWPDRRGGQRSGHHRRSGHRHGRVDLRRRGLPRRALLRSAHRSVRAQEALHHHADRVPDRYRADGVLDEPAVVLRLPLHHRLRHRWRVRGDQFGDRRADPEPRAGTRRPDHQRQLLARRGRRGAAVDRDAQRVDLPDQRRLARGVRPRGPARLRRPDRSAPRTREPALAVHPRPRGRGESADRRDRAPGRALDRREAGSGRRDDHDPAATVDPLHRDRPHDDQALSQAHHAGLRAVRRAGVPLQRRSPSATRRS